MEAGPDRAGRKALRPLACAALLALAGASLAGCAPAAVGTAPSSAPSSATVAVPFGTAPLPSAPRTTAARRLTPPALAPLGSFIASPTTQRPEPVFGDLSRTAVLIGDSQSEPVDSWVRQGLAGAGYSVYFSGAGGTGYSVGNGRVRDYAGALRLGDWRLPSGRPQLVVVQGGGNDASRGATDAAIVSGATAIVTELRRTYPGARIVMVGVLARSAWDGGGRRTSVDALLARTASELGVAFIPCGDWISRYGLAGDLADTVHLTTTGKARLAPVLAGALAKEGLTLR